MDFLMNNKITVKLVPSIFMKGFFAALCVAVIINFFNTPVKGQSADKKELKIMSFNIRYGTADDGEDSWEYRKENTFATVKTFNPDVFGLQEALQIQIDEFLAQMPNFACVGVGRDDGKQAGEHSCIFYSKDRFVADTTSNFWFSDMPSVPGSKTWGNNITRICSWVLLKDKITGKSFYFFNVHLDHQSQPSREKSAKLLVARIAEKSLPVILTGDFNCDENNPAIKTILDFGLIDSYRKLNEKKTDEGTFHSFSGKTDGEKIDFIFVSKDFDASKSEIVHTSYNGRFPSDHFPVTSVISFKE
jgi:endonuclease/exonuclease/phosphatase family metal-dependent hydrolase